MVGTSLVKVRYITPLLVTSGGHTSYFFGLSGVVVLGRNWLMYLLV